MKVLSLTGGKYLGVAELVYAADLKSAALKGLGVRFPSPRPSNKENAKPLMDINGKRFN